MSEYGEFLDKQIALTEALSERVLDIERYAEQLRAERIALIEQMAFEGNNVASRWLAEIVAAAEDPEEQDRALRNIAGEWQQMKRLMRRTHGRLSRVIGENTGMTIDDFVWLRDYEDYEDGE